MSITVVQTATPVSGATSISFGSNITPGNTVVLALASSNSMASTTPSITGNSETLSLAELDADDFAGIWYYSGVGASPGKVIGWSGPINGFAWEVSGLAASPLDQVSSTDTTSSSSWTSGSTATTTVPAEFWAGVVRASATVSSITPGGSWSNSALISSNSMAGEQIVAAEAAAVYSGTSGSSATWYAAVATFKGPVVPNFTRPLLVGQAVKCAAYY